MECVECGSRYPGGLCGRKVFVEGTCSVCSESTRPFVLLPCGHGLCEGDFSRMGGVLQGESPPAGDFSRMGGVLQGQSPPVGDFSRMGGVLQGQSPPAPQATSMECAECHAKHPQACGRKLFVEATCSVCSESVRPFVMLPCGHGLCEGDFSRMGGLLQDQNPSAPQATSLSTQQVAGDGRHDVGEGYFDADGICVGFRLEGLGCLNYYEDGQLKVHTITSLVRRGRNVHLSGSSAGPWGSSCVSTAPSSSVAQRAVELFEQRYATL